MYKECPHYTVYLQYSSVYLGTIHTCKAAGDCFWDGKKWDGKAEVSSRRSWREAKE